MNANTLYVAAILFFRSTLHREALPCLPNYTGADYWLEDKQKIHDACFGCWRQTGLCQSLCLELLQKYSIWRLFTPLCFILTQLLPDLSSIVTKAQHCQKAAFQLGDTVYSKAYGRGQPKWVPAIVVQKTGPVSYLVQLDDTTTVKRHFDQLRKRHAPFLLPQSPTVVVTTEISVSDSNL